MVRVENQDAFGLNGHEKSTLVAGTTTNVMRDIVRKSRQNALLKVNRSCRLKNSRSALQITSILHVTVRRAIYGYEARYIRRIVCGKKKLKQSSTRHEKQMDQRMRCPLQLVLTGVFGTFT